MQGDDDNRPAESSDTTRRDRAGTQAAEPRRVVSDDSAAHDRHDEGAPAARRQELDRKQPLDASGNIAERVRATTFTGGCEWRGCGGCERGGGCGCGSSWTRRARRCGRGENAHPSGARAAADETISARPTRFLAASSASAQRRETSARARARRWREATRGAKAPRAQERRAGRSSSEVLRGRGGARACVRTPSLNTGI